MQFTTKRKWTSRANSTIKTNSYTDLHLSHYFFSFV